MKTRKFFLTLALGVLCLTSGCTQKPIETRRVKIWHYYNNEQLSAFQSLISSFNRTVGKEKHIIVEELSLGYVNDLANAIIDAASQKRSIEEMPDMFMSYPDTAYQVDQLGKIASLDSYFTKEELNEYNPRFIEEGKLVNQGSLKIIPIAKSTEALYINKTDFEKFTSANPSVSYDNLSTIESIIDVSKLYYEYSGGKAFYGRDSLSNYFIVGAKQLGIDLLDYDENEDFFVNLDKEVFKTLWDNYYVPIVQGYFTSHGRFRSNDVQNGNIICYTGSTSSSSYFPDSVIVDDDNSYKIEPKVLPAPIFSSGEDFSVIQGAGVCVTESTIEKEEACVEFLKWFTDGDINVNFSLSSSYLPVKTEKLNLDLVSKVNTTVEKESFIVALNAINKDKLYTNVASIKGEPIRSLLDATLNTTANSALQAINKAEAAGISHEAAVEEYINNDAFDAWYSSMIKDIKALCE